MNLPTEFGAVSQSSRFVHKVRTDATQLNIDADLQARQKQLAHEGEVATCTAEMSKASSKLGCLKDLILEAYVEPLKNSGLRFNVSVSPIEPVNKDHQFSDDPMKGFSRQGVYKIILHLKGRDEKMPFEIVLTCNTRAGDKDSLGVNLWAGTEQVKKADDHRIRSPDENPQYERTGERNVVPSCETDVEALNAPLVQMMPGWLHRLSQADPMLSMILREGQKKSTPFVFPG